MSKLWAWAVLILTGAFALSPALTSGFAGFEKDQFPVVLEHWPAQPAGWAFSIWGVIYLWLIASAVYGVWKRRDAALWQKARPALALSLAVGVFWIAVANSAPVVASVMIVVMAARAILALIRAGDVDPWLLRGPLGLYAGWLTAASGVAWAVVLSGHGIMAPQPAAMVLLSMVLVVALLVQRKTLSLSYPLAVCWALIGVIAANASAAYWPVAALAAVGIALVGGQAGLRRRSAVR